MIFVPTRDRAAALATALASHRSALDRAGRAVRVVVVDDSDAEGPARAACVRTSAEHAGRATRERLLRELATNAEERAALAGALFAPAERMTTCVGATRNVIALLAAGAPFVSIDDDSPSVYVRPRASLAPKRVVDPQPIELGPLSDVVPTEADPFGPHARYLGRPARDAAPEAPDRFRIAMTFVGVHGDLGVGSVGQLAFMVGESQRRLADGLLEHVVAGGATARLARCVQPSLVPFAMMGAYGADATRLLPPLLPAGRNEDGLFALVLRLVDPEAAFVHLPLAIAHRPGEGRRFDLTSFESYGATPRLADLVRLVLTGVHPTLPQGDPAARLRALGAALDEVPSLGRLAEAWNEERASWSRHLLTNAAGCPRGALRDGTERLAAALARPTTLDATAEGLPIVDSIRRYGRLCAVWPDVWARAVTTREATARVA